MSTVASVASTHPRAKQSVAALGDTPVPTGPGRYYDGMLYMLAMLHCGGGVHARLPQQKPRFRKKRNMRMTKTLPPLLIVLLAGHHPSPALCGAAPGSQGCRPRPARP